MDFKWTLSRPGIELEFDTGSIAEAVELLTQEGTAITEVFGLSMGAPATTTEAPAAPEPKKPRGRPAKAAVEAVAPDPLPVPALQVAPPPVLPMPTTVLPPNQLAPAVDTTPNANGIPAFLDRAQAPAASPPPLPTPPVSTLGPKVVKALDERAKGAADGGQALADWLAAHNLTIKGKSYDEACRAVLMIGDEKLAAVAAQLGVS